MNGIKPTWESECKTVNLWLADCLDVLPHLQGVDAVVTDPPYGMSFVSNHRQDKHLAIQGDGDANLLNRIIHRGKHNARHSTYVFCRWDNLRDIEFPPKSLVHWVKNNWSMGDLEHEHARQTESILFYPGPKHAWGNGRPTDVVYAPRTDNELHPTQKSLELMEQVLKWSLGSVLDPFMGSGTTGVACVRTGRKFLGIEKEPKYFEIARRRISDELIKKTGNYKADPKKYPLLSMEGEA